MSKEIHANQSLEEQIEELKQKFKHQCENCQILMQDRVKEITKLKEILQSFQRIAESSIDFKTFSALSKTLKDKLKDGEKTDVSKVLVEKSDNGKLDKLKEVLQLLIDFLKKSNIRIGWTHPDKIEIFLNGLL